MYEDEKAKIVKNARPLADLLGIAVALDDTEAMPLQASDLWASTVRTKMANMQSKSSDSIRALMGSRVMLHHPVTAAELDDYMMQFNVALSVKILSKVSRKEIT
jgi:hypothetical protein